MTIVALDSNVLIYAGVVPRTASSSSASPEQMELTRRAKILLHQHRDDQVILPMVAVSELLIPVHVSKHGSLIIALRELFICPEFNDQAASIAADLWARYKKIPADRRYDDRHIMRADVKIVASAKAAGASTFYTNDGNCRSLADLVMIGKPLPKASSDLFIDEILEGGLESRPKSTPKRKKGTKRRQ